MAYVGLLDASVLHPWVVCDLLLRLAERGLYRPAWSAEILDEVVNSLTERRPEHAERFRRRREQMEAAFAEAMTPRPERFASVVPDEVHEGDRHVVAAALAARADVIVTNNARHFAPDRLAESGLLVQTADEFLVHQWWLDPHGVDEVLAEMGDATRRPPLTVEQVLDSLARSAPEFVALVRDQALSRGRLTCVLCPFDRDPNYGLGDGHRHADRDDPTTAIADELAAREGLRTLDACGEAGSRALGDGPRAMAVRRGRVLDVRKQRLGILAKVDPGSFLPRDRSAMRTGAPRRRPVAVDVLAREPDVRPDVVLGDHEVPFGAWASIGDGERRRAGVRLSFSAGRAGDQFGDRK